MKKKTVSHAFLFTFLFVNYFTFAQKVDLDKFRIPVERITLPSNFTPLEKRTYKFAVTATSSVTKVLSLEDIGNTIKIFNFKQAEPAFIEIEAKFGDLVIVKNEVEDRTFKSQASTAAPSNPSFYAKISFKTSGIIIVKADGKDIAKYGLDRVPGFMGDYDRNTMSVNPDWINVWYPSEEFKSSSDAYNYYVNNKEVVRDQLIRKFVANTLERALNDTNQKYGFAPAKGQETVWNLDSRKHPEHEAYQKACAKMKEAFSKMRSTESITAIAEELKPTIDYFEGIKAKYASDDKSDKKLQYGSFYALAFLYYYLDMPDKAIEKGNELIKNEYDEKDGKEWVSKATQLKKVMELNKVTGTHFAVEGI